MPATTPHRISDAQHRENKRQLRELRRQLAALNVEGRKIRAKNRARWVAEKEAAAVALKWARALPESEQAFYLTGRWRGEPLGSCVLRHREQWRNFCRVMADALAKCAAENVAENAALATARAAGDATPPTTPYESFHS